MRLNVPPVTLPFWVPCTHLYFYIFLNWLTVRLKNKTGVVEEENGRETGERTDCPPVPSALCTSAFEACDGTKGGTFSNASIFCIQFIVYSRLPQRRLAFSPTALDSEYVGFGLRVCKDGLIIAILWSASRKVSIRCLSDKQTTFKR